MNRTPLWGKTPAQLDAERQEMIARREAIAERDRQQHDKASPAALARKYSQKLDKMAGLDGAGQAGPALPVFNGTSHVIKGGMIHVSNQRDGGSGWSFSSSAISGPLPNWDNLGTDYAFGDIVTIDVPVTSFLHRILVALHLAKPKTRKETYRVAS